MGFSWEDFRNLRSRIDQWKDAEQIILPPDEYAEVMSEFNTHMSDEDRKRSLVTKPIGNYYYTIINKGFDEYIIIGKRPIIDAVERQWEDTK